jgi:hypothetical protein
VRHNSEGVLDRLEPSLTDRAVRKCCSLHSQAVVRVSTSVEVSPENFLVAAQDDVRLHKRPK